MKDDLIAFLRARIAEDKLIVEQDERHWSEVPDLLFGNRRLAEEIVKQLDPEVVVEMPAPTVAEALTAVMAEVDAANSAY